MQLVLTSVYDDAGNIVRNVFGKRNDDAAHELLIKVSAYDRAIELHSRGELTRWMGRVAKNMFIDATRKPVHSVELKRDFAQASTQSTRDVYEDMKFVRKHLTQMENLWLDAYIESDMSYVEFSRRFNISRQACSRHVEAIKKKIQEIKRNDPEQF